MSEHDSIGGTAETNFTLATIKHYEADRKLLNLISRRHRVAKLCGSQMSAGRESVKAVDALEHLRNHGSDLEGVLLARALVRLEESWRKGGGEGKPHVLFWTVPSSGVVEVEEFWPEGARLRFHEPQSFGRVFRPVLKLACDERMREIPGLPEVVEPVLPIVVDNVTTLAEAMVNLPSVKGVVGPRIRDDVELVYQSLKTISQWSGNSRECKFLQRSAMMFLPMASELLNVVEDFLAGKEP